MKVGENELFKSINITEIHIDFINENNNFLSDPEDFNKGLEGDWAGCIKYMKGNLYGEITLDEGTFDEVVAQMKDIVKKQTKR